MLEFVEGGVCVSVDYFEAEGAGFDGFEFDGEAHIALEGILESDFAVEVVHFCAVFVACHCESLEFLDVVAVLRYLYGVPFGRLLIWALMLLLLILLLIPP